MTIKRHVGKLLVSAVAIVTTASGAAAQTATNVNATNLLSGFTQLGSTAAGRTVLNQNLATAIGINNSSTVAARNQAIADNTTASLVGGTTNGLNLADGLGPRLLAIYQTRNTVAQNFSSTAVSANVSRLFSQLNAITTASDSAFVKNYFANGTSNGVTPATNVSLPAGGVFNVYDRAYNPLPANANLIGDSRPVQVAPDRIQAFTGPDYFGISTNSATIFPTLRTNASFPSGHSSAGLTSSILLAMIVPERFQQELTRGGEFANSRVVLGVHYPLDAIGARIHTLQAIVLALNNDPNYLNKTVPGLLGGTVTTTGDFKALFAAAQADVRGLLQTCAGGIAACAMATADDRFGNAALNKANYNFWLTYGLSPVGQTNLDPVVPVGAEVLIATRFPYLAADQLREVLATTEIASGQPLDDGSGYARLNLYNAADGYGAFRGAVTVTMDAARGGVNAYDIWANAIGDYRAPSTGIVTPGSLVKAGSGTLELSGANSWSGTTTISGGTLLFSGTSRLGGALVNNSILSLTRNDGAVGRTLTVGGYNGGSGSQLVVAAQLGGAGSRSDQLIVTGDVAAASRTAITVINTTPNAAGGYDPVGVPIVTVAKGKAATAANFTLAGGPVSKGLFQYQLVFNADPEWRLVSLPTADAYRFAALATGAQDIWFETANIWNYHQMELRDAVANESGRKGALWGKAFHSWTDRDAIQTTTSFSSSFAFDAGYKRNTSAFVGGVDGGAEGVLGADDALLFGVSGGYIDAKQKFAGGTRAKYKGPTFAMYGSYGAGGFFIDGMFKADLLKLRFSAPALSASGQSVDKVDSAALGVTGNIGYKIQVGTATSLQPLATLSYVNADIDRLRIAGAAIGFNRENALRGRLGAQLDSTLSSGLALSGSASWWKRLDGRSSATIDSGATSPLLRLTDDTVDSFGQVSGKLEYRSTAGWSVSARGEYGFGQDYRSASVQAGARVTF